MKRVEFLALVLASVNFLKENATTEEKAKLGHVNRPYNTNGCVLGQMVGSSESPRALELKQSLIYCDKVVFDRLCSEGVKVDHATILNELEGTSPRMTEACLEAYVTQPNNNTMQGASPFELFILMDGANTNDLVAYVKGEKETFEPTFAEV